MRKTVIIALLVVVCITFGLWVVGTFVQPNIPQKINNNIIFFFAIFVAVIAALAGFKDVIELIQTLSRKNIANQSYTKNDFAFEVFNTYNESNLLPYLLPGGTKDIPFFNSPYKERSNKFSTTKMILDELQQKKKILIKGKSGIGKTREVGEICKKLIAEGWTILVLRENRIYIPNQHPAELPLKKLVFVIDDIHARCAEKIKEPDGESPEKNFQNNIDNLINWFKNHTTDIWVICTTRSEEEEWGKLRFESEKLWLDFHVIELEPPSDHTIVDFLRDYSTRKIVNIKDEDLSQIAKANDETYLNPIINLIRAKENGFQLTTNNFQPSNGNTWLATYKSYKKAFQHLDAILDAIELSRYFGLELWDQLVLSIAIDLKPSLWSKFTYQIKLFNWNSQFQTLKKLSLKGYLPSRDNILMPRDGQVEARDTAISIKSFSTEEDKYEDFIVKLSLKEYAKNPARMSVSIENLTETISNALIIISSLEPSAQSALKKANRAIKLNSANPAFYYMRGRIYTFLHDHENALNDYSKSIELLETTNQEKAFMAWSEFLMGDYRPQSTVIARITVPIVLFHRARSNMATKRYREAIDDLRKAIKLDSCSQFYCEIGEAYYELGEIPNAIEYFTLAIQKNWATNSNTLLISHGMLARIYMSSGEFNSAISHLDSCIDLQPNILLTLRMRAEAFANTGNFDKALDDANKIIEIDSSDIEIYLNRGKIYLELSKKQESIQDFITASTIRPNNAKVWSLITETIDRLSYDESYESLIHSFLDKHPESALIHYLYGRFQYEQKRFVDAFNCFKTASNLDSQFADAVYRQSLYYGMNKNFDKSIEIISRAIEIDSNNPRYYRERAAINWKKVEKSEEALLDYKRAIEINPKDVPSIINIASILLEQKKYEEAIIYFNQALSIDAQFEGVFYVYYKLGECFGITGKIDMAIDNFEIALQNRPSSFWEKEISERLSYAIQLKSNANKTG